MADRASNIKLSDTNDIEVNPATEDKQDDIINSLNGASYDTLIDETTTANTAYIWTATIWSATSSAVWRIKRIDESGSVTNIWWADSNTNFDNIRDNRASLSYSQ